eukprot:4688520-Pleurochrysis_carterae.AAC.1
MLVVPAGNQTADTSAGATVRASERQQLWEAEQRTQELRKQMEAAQVAMDEAEHVSRRTRARLGARELAVTPLQEQIAALKKAAAAEADAAHAAEIARMKAAAQRQADAAREEGAARSALDGGQRRERELEELRAARARSA